MFVKTGSKQPERICSQVGQAAALCGALLLASAPVPRALAQPTAPAASEAAEAQTPSAPPQAAAPVHDGAAASEPAAVASDPQGQAAERVEELETSFDLLPTTPKAQGGLTAEYVKQRAVEVSGRSRTASARAKNAEANAKRAFALFAPQVDLTARYTRLSEIDLDDSLFNIPATDAMGNPIDQPDFNIYFPNNYSLKGTIRVPVSDYFLSLSDRYQRVQHLQSVQALQARGEKQTVAHEAVRDYIALARAVGTQRLSEYRVGQIEQFVEEIRVLVEGGERSKLDLAFAKARLASAKAVAANARATLSGYKMGLRVRLELELTSPVGVGEPLIEQRPQPPKDLMALIRTADSERPEILALRELIIANQHARDDAAGTRYPKLSLFGEAELANPNSRYFPLNQEWQPTWAAGVELYWSPNDLAVTANELDRSELELVRAENELRDLRARVASEVTNAYEGAVAATAAVESSEVAVASAEETAEVQLSLYLGGEATSRDVLDAEVELREAQLRWLDNVLNAHLAQIDLQHATGQLRF